MEWPPTFGRDTAGRSQQVHPSCIARARGGLQEDLIQVFTPARPEVARSPAGLGSMSTQRRETRWQCNGYESRQELREPSGFAPDSRLCRAAANGGTARPDGSATQATNSLQKDHPLVRLALPGGHGGSPPLWTGRYTYARRSSLSLLSVLTGSSRLPLAMPQAPAALSRRAERYDGKRDLYFFHAA